MRTTDYVLFDFESINRRNLKSSKTVVCERGDSFRRPLPGKIRASSLRASTAFQGSKHLSLSLLGHQGRCFCISGCNLPVGGNRFVGIKGMRGRSKAGHASNPRRAAAGCACDDHFNKKKEADHSYESRRCRGLILFNMQQSHFSHDSPVTGLVADRPSFPKYTFGEIVKENEITKTKASVVNWILLNGTKGGWNDKSIRIEENVRASLLHPLAFAMLESAANLLEVVRGRVSADKDEAEVFRLLSGAAAEEMGSGNRDSNCVVGFIEDVEGKMFA
ncbi:hypothetical protein TNCV_1541001 [Trichonephila clavipes]|nr:hypothetical protein TNCV_1541001 [Trichonephila clavipes]